MKYRVTREMPGLKVGDVIDLIKGDFHPPLGEKIILKGCYLKDLIRDGWLSEVEEPQILAEKIGPENARIAREHYLGEFDESYNDISPYMNLKQTIDTLRRRLFGEDET